ncbi:hypothetical protein KL933_005194 [Ogataea haglerorum]|uniref:Uncharacterized protein n=1 Tax=Ogataea haglerorum TaxID=1937702 RepID=A0AAN6D0Y3_9ASCO|nr:hypothetical protein KL933_005194 [Ogataea haglerorum]
MQQVSWEKLQAEGNPLLSPAYKSNGHVFTSGNVGSRPDGTFPSDVAEQTKLAIQKLERVLHASDSSLSQVLKVLLFIADPKDAATVNSVYKDYFPNMPSRSCVVVGFPNKQVKVELECVASYNQRGSKL